MNIKIISTILSAVLYITSANAQQVKITPDSGAVYNLTLEQSLIQISAANDRKFLTPKDKQGEDKWFYDHGVKKLYDLGYIVPELCISPELNAIASSPKDTENKIKNSKSKVIYIIHNHSVMEQDTIGLPQGFSLKNTVVGYKPPSYLDLITASKNERIAKSYEKRLVNFVVDGEGYWMHWFNKNPTKDKLPDILHLYKVLKGDFENSLREEKAINKRLYFPWKQKNDFDFKKESIKFIKELEKIGIYMRFIPRSLVKESL